MDYATYLGAAIIAIWFLIGVLKKAVPKLAGEYSRFIPIIALALGIAVAVYGSYLFSMNIVEIILTGIVPALGSAGAHSYTNEIKGAL